MFPNLETPDFVSAVESVGAELGCTVSRSLALHVIHTVYDLRRGETGDEFRALFNVAISMCGIETSEMRPYELITGRYFNHRSVRANQARGETDATKNESSADTSGKEVSFPRVVGCPNTNEVSIEILEGLELVVFETKKEKGHLAWGDVNNPVCHPVVLPSEFSKAKRMALAIMNDKRQKK